MIYPHLDLRVTAIVTGLLLLAMHGACLLHGPPIRAGLRALPRSEKAGWLLLTIAAVWFFALATFTDLGEFTKFRRLIQVGTVVSYWLTLRHVDEFLSVRALGMLFLLLAELLLEAAFLQPETWRLLLVVLAYAMIIKGMFWVGMPYLLRDQVAWITRTDRRWRAGSLAGLAYAAAILISGLIPRHSA